MEEEEHKKKREPSSAAGVSSDGEGSHRKSTGGTMVGLPRAPDTDESVGGNFSAALWRRQVCEAEDLIASHKLLLFVLGELMDEDGKCFANYEDIANISAISTVVVGRIMRLLEERGWYKRERKAYGYDYVALKGRDMS